MVRGAVIALAATVGAGVGVSAGNDERLALLGMVVDSRTIHIPHKCDLQHSW
jgi:hypothetical protein